MNITHYSHTLNTKASAHTHTHRKIHTMRKRRRGFKKNPEGSARDSEKESVFWELKWNRE
jgi:hypothetical protein